MKLPKYKFRFLIIFAIPIYLGIFTLGSIQSYLSVFKSYENENKNPITKVNPKDTSFKEIAINSYHFIPYSLNQHLNYELDIIIIGNSLATIKNSKKKDENSIAKNIDSIITIYWEVYEYNHKILSGTSKYQVYDCQYEDNIDTEYTKPLFAKYFKTGDYYLKKTFGQFSLSSLWSYKLRYKVINNNDNNNENKYFLQFGIASGEYMGRGSRDVTKMTSELIIIFSILIFVTTLIIASLLYIYLYKRSLKKEMNTKIT